VFSFKIIFLFILISKAFYETLFDRQDPSLCLFFHSFLISIILYFSILLNWLKITPGLAKPSSLSSYLYPIKHHWKEFTMNFAVFIINMLNLFDGMQREEW